VGWESQWEPVVLCLVGLRSGRRLSFWGPDARLRDFFREHRDDVFLAHHAPAEMKYLNRHRAGGSPTVFRFSSLEQVSKGADGVFSLRQQRVILDVMAEATELAGESAWDMELAPEAARLLGFGAPTTFRQAVAILTDRRDKAQARDFVKAVLRLRYDARIQGEEVPHVGGADHSGDGSGAGRTGH
jgi:hypothetical protein